MPQKPFDASRVKLKRARFHIGTLMEETRKFLLSHPFHLEVEGDPDPNIKWWRVHVREEVPLDFSAIMGDSIHNLRAALDLMACELVRLNGKNDDDVYFPFAKSAAEFPAQIRNRRMDQASPQAIALLMTFQPYHGGNAPLRAIHDLDIMDKHQALISTSDMLAMPDWLGGPELVRGVKIGPIRDGWRVRAYDPMVPYLRVGSTYHGTFSLHLPVVTLSGQPGPLGGHEVVPTLIRLANLVDSIIEAFAVLYP